MSTLHNAFHAVQHTRDDRLPEAFRSGLLALLIVASLAAIGAPVLITGSAPAGSQESQPLDLVPTHAAPVPVPMPAAAGEPPRAAATASPAISATPAISVVAVPVPTPPKP